MIDMAAKRAWVAAAEDPQQLAALVEQIQKFAPPATLAYFEQYAKNPNSIEAKLSVSKRAKLYLDPELAGFRAAAAPGDIVAAVAVSMWILRNAFVRPEDTLAVMDGLTKGWLAGQKQVGQPRGAEGLGDKATIAEWRQALGLEGVAAFKYEPSQTSRPIAAELEQLFWQQVLTFEDPQIIEKIIAYTGGFSADLLASYDQAMLGHAGMAETYREKYLRPALDIKELGGCPSGSLGYAYYHQIVDNGLEVEIVKGNMTNVESRSVLVYAAQRILQVHDLWHCLTEYSTNPLDEIALQAFQLAQLGSPFSSNLLATLIVRSVFFIPNELKYLLEYISGGWQHGRGTPNLLGIKWEQHWNEGLGQLRQQYAIKVKPSFAVADN
jgi:ubiquinone biosynthesis protein Coq4